MSEYQMRIRSRRPDAEDWGTVSYLKGNNIAKLREEARECLTRWQSAAMDRQSPLYNWEFRIDGSKPEKIRISRRDINQQYAGGHR
jgi:hypothetical protein